MKKPEEAKEQLLHYFVEANKIDNKLAKQLSQEKKLEDLEAQLISQASQGVSFWFALSRLKRSENTHGCSKHPPSRIS